MRTDRSHTRFSIPTAEPGLPSVPGAQQWRQRELSKRLEKREGSYAKLPPDSRGCCRLGRDNARAVSMSRTKPALWVAGASGYCHQLPGYSELDHNSLLRASC